MSEGVLESGEHERKITMIPNSCDLELFENRNSPAKQVLDQKIFKDNFTLIHPGSMGEANGLDYIVKAAKLLKEKEINDVVFLLTGDGKTRPVLEEFCRKHNLSNVIFTGNIPKKDMPALLAEVDVTITSFKNVPILATNSPNKFF